MASSEDRPQIESRRSKHTTKFDRICTDGGMPRLFGKRPHLAKDGREIANAAAEAIQREEPEYVDDPDDPTLGEVLKYVERNAADQRAVEQVRRHQTATLTDLLTEGLTFREAVTFYMYEHAGLTLREIYHIDEGKTRSFSREQDRQAERNVASTIQTAAEKLGVDVDVAIQ